MAANNTSHAQKVTVQIDMPPRNFFLFLATNGTFVRVNATINAARHVG